MKRSIKNIIMGIVIFIMIGSMFFTMNYVKNKVKVATNDQQSMNNQGPPGMNNNQTNKSDSNIRQDNSSNGQNSNTNNTAYSKRQGPPSGERPTKPSANTSDTTNTDNQTNTTNNNDMKQHPEKPEDNNTSDNTQNNNDTSANQNQHHMQHNDTASLSTNVPTSTNLSYGYYIVFGLESVVIATMIMYLVLSRFNKKSFKETFKTSDKMVINVLAIIILTSGLTWLDSKITKDYFINNTCTQSEASTNNNISVNADGTKEVDGTSETITGNVEASEADQSSVVVKNGGKATIKKSTIKKTGGDSTNTENSEFYGVNSGVLVTKNSKAKIKKSKIKTNAKGSNAVFATGENAKVTVSDTTIETTGESSSRGLDATYGGTIEANNVTITTQGGSSATLATDRGEGTVSATDSTLQTNGSGSPLIYSTGNISVSNTTGIANNSQMVVIEGKNSATVTSSNLEASGSGNRGDTDKAGVMIYQSMSGDASEGTGTFTAKDSSLTISSSSDDYKTAPMFFITNTQAVINLENTKLQYGSNILLSIKGTSEWGNTGSNGGDTTLNASNQELNGNIEVDNISSLIFNLTKSTYKGTINNSDSAKEISLKLDKDSKITLTGDSYVTSLEDADESYSNIDFNGYKLYVNGKAIN